MKLDELRAGAEAGTLPAAKAMKALLGLASWRNRAWRRARRQRLADRCDVCSSTRRLRIVDQWRPAELAELCEQAANALRDEYALSHPLVLPELPAFDPATVPPPVAEQRDCCPWCGSVDITFQSSSGGWFCQGTRRGRKCGHIFSQPAHRSYQRWSHTELIAQAQEARDAALRQPAEAWEAAFQAEFKAEIERRAVLLALVQWERYLAVEPTDVQTLCKRCAAKKKAAAMLAAPKLPKKPAQSSNKAPGRGTALFNRLRQMFRALRPRKWGKTSLTGS